MLNRIPLCLWAFVVFCILLGAPAFSQVNLSGVWENLGILHEDWPDRLFGPELGDYGGVPLTDEARLRADTWDASLITLPEYQCRVHPSDYAPSFAGIRIWEERDKDSQQLIAIHIHHFAWGTERTIWMDGRPHPPDYALHTAMGFSTGKWQGDILTVNTTHFKEGWIRRNGIPRSDRAAVVEHFIRHADGLTLMTVITDPIYLTEPMVRTREYEYLIGGQIGAYPCEPVEEIVRPKGVIPHHLPGTNVFLNEYADKHRLPREAARGGAETMYPEYRAGAGSSRGASAKADAYGIPKASSDEIHVLPVVANVYMIVGPGGNTTVQVGKDGVLVVDTQPAQVSDKLLAAIRTLSEGPIRYIINTGYDRDHTSGNEPIRKAGSTIAGGNVSGDIQDAAVGAQIIAHDNVLKRMTSAPSGAWPTSTFLSDQKKLFFNGEGVEIAHRPAAHTDGDSIVFFRRSDVIATGELFTTTSYPVIDVAAGGTINGFIDGLNRLVDMIIPVYGQEGGTLVIPGHGRLSDFGDVLNYREMTIIIRDRIQDMIKKGLTLEQVKTARPTRDYDPLYGSGDRLVEAAYQTLKKGK